MPVYVVFQRMNGEGEEKRAVVIGQVRTFGGVAIFSNVELEQLVTAREIHDRDGPGAS